MSNSLNIGIIKCGETEQWYELQKNVQVSGYNVRKVFMADGQPVSVGSTHYPDAEIVLAKEAITEDRDIDLVLVCTPLKAHKSLISDVIRSGKSVRVC